MIIGIDGGGSKTEFLLCNLEGKKLAYFVRPSIHYQQVGFRAYQNTICEGIESLCKETFCNRKDIDFICIGVPGYGESAVDTAQLNQLAAEIISCAYELLNDVKVAWAGSLACQAGISILAGTGSMAYAVDEEGQNLRTGGWGEIFGDEGSGYWLGKEACRLFSKMSDGRIKKGPLYNIVKEHLAISTDFSLINYVYQMADQRKEMAQLAQLLYQAYMAGDLAAGEIFSQAASELAAMVNGVLRLYRGKRPVRLSYNGGVFGAGKSFVAELDRVLKIYCDSVILQAPKLNPVAGACLYGAQKLGLDTSIFLAKLAAPSLLNNENHTI